MAIALGFGQGNKNTPMAGSTGGGTVMQPKVNANGQLGLTTDGTGGLLNYLKSLTQQPAAGAGVAQAAQAAAPAASTAGALSGGL
jgi:hypothetical protein